MYTDTLIINYELKALEIKPIFYFNFDIFQKKIFNSIIFLRIIVLLIYIGFRILIHLILNIKWDIFI